MKHLVFLIITSILLSSCSSERQKEKIDKNRINIFCAMGASQAISEIVDSFLVKGNIDVTFNFASSGTLARQIEQGAQCDIYISANKQWIDFLSENNLLIDSTVEKLVGNRLAIICPKERTVTFEFTPLFDVIGTVESKISIGDPGYVPVGKYAMQVLDTLGWSKLLADKVIPARDVSSVLRYVELEEVDWGIVYYTEALKSEKVDIAAMVPDSLHQSIKFYVALIKGSTDQAIKLKQYLYKDVSQKIFQKHGFETAWTNK
jgi:molybdate transport system substrate-binding protein